MGKNKEESNFGRSVHIGHNYIYEVGRYLLEFEPQKKLLVAGIITLGLTGTQIVFKVMEIKELPNW